MLRSLRDADVLCGLMFIAFAVTGFALSTELESGSAMVMGPGYFPRLLSAILLVLGIAITAVGLWGGARNPTHGWTVRPLAMVSVAALLFAALLQKGGIVLAIAVAVIVGSFAGAPPRATHLALLTVALVLGSVALFVWGIGIPLPIWPSWPR
jgi:hypothetical protein